MERDGLVSTLQRTVEESKRMVMEGDEQVERITKESERIAWYTMNIYILIGVEYYYLEN